jgi:alkylation response protein AidB-like acyl-CoA dehydrogenase
MTFAVQPTFAGHTHDTALRFGNNVALRRSGVLHVLQDAARTSCELCWPALLVREESGGAGGSLPELAAMAEGSGRSGLFLPLATLCHGVPLMLEQAAAAGQHEARKLLSALTGGTAIIGRVAVDHSAPAPAEGLAATQQADGSWQIEGRIWGVAAIRATHYLVDTGTPGAPLLAVAADQAGLQASPAYLGPDGAPRIALHFDVVTVPASQALLQAAPLAALREQMLQAGVLVVAAQCVGAMGRLLELTVDYLSTRQQSGVALSTFQALRHQAADMYAGYENFRALTQSAFRDAQGPSLPPARLVSLIKLSLGRTARQLAETAIQVHSGMGMTQELLVARLIKRLLAAESGCAEHLEQAQGHLFPQKLAA